MRLRRALPLSFVLGVAGATYIACADDDPSTPPADVDASLTLDGSANDATSSADGTVEAGTDAQVTTDAATEAATDASLDASDAADAGPQVALFAHVTGKLHRVDPTTAAMTFIGDTGQNDVRMYWDPAAGVMRGIVDALTAPKISTINLCTGAITLGPRLTKALDAGLVARAECIARHPNGTWYAGADWNGDPPNSPGSESLVTLETDSGIATRIVGPIQTTQNDCDTAAFIGTDFYVLDPAQPTTNGLWRVDIVDGGGVKVGSPPTEIVRIGWDESRATLFGYGQSQRLFKLDVGDASATVVGNLASDATTFDSITAAPVPVCP